MLRDLDLFDELSRLTYVGIASTVTTLDEPVRRVIEPGAAPSRARLEMLREFAGAPGPWWEYTRCR